MIFITLTSSGGTPIAVNIEAIGYFVVGLGLTEVFITGGLGGLLHVKETPAEIIAKLKKLGEYEDDSPSEEIGF